MDLPILLASAFLFGPVPSGLIAFVGLFDPREITGQLSMTCALYNRSQKAISVMAGALVFEAAGAKVGVWPTVVVGAMLALAADCGANYTLVTVASMLLQGNSVDSRLVSYEVWSRLDIRLGLLVSGSAGPDLG